MNAVFPQIDIVCDQNLPGGEPWYANIEGMVRRCHATVILCLPRSSAHPWFFFEAGLARGAGHPCFPVLIRGATKPDLDLLGNLQYRDAAQITDMKRLIVGLADTFLSEKVLSAWPADDAIAEGAAKLVNGLAPLRAATPADAAGAAADSFAKAFGDVFGLQEFTGAEALSRLSTFLAPPLWLDSRGTRLSLFDVWHRSHSVPLERFEVDKACMRCTVADDDIRLKSLAVYRSAQPERSFVYLVVDPDVPSGAANLTIREREEQVRRLGYVRETVGKGQAVRYRYLTPHNLLITCRPTAFREEEHRNELTDWLDQLLGGRRELADFIDWIEWVPVGART